MWYCMHVDGDKDSPNKEERKNREGRRRHGRNHHRVDRRIHSCAGRADRYPLNRLEKYTKGEKVMVEIIIASIVASAAVLVALIATR